MDENQLIENENISDEDVSSDIEESLEDYESPSEETVDVSGNTQSNDSSGNTTVYVTNDVDLTELLRELRTLHTTDSAILTTLGENLPAQILIKPSVIYSAVIIIITFIFIFGRKN